MMRERLNWLLQALDVQGKVLAAAIGVDDSTMSKWRKGKRTLKYHSPYVQKIADFVFTSPLEEQAHVVQEMLCKAAPKLRGADVTVLKDAFCHWLTTPELQEHGSAANLEGTYEVPVETCIGMRNMFDAQRRFFALLEDLPVGQQITVTDFSAVDWNQVEPELIAANLEYTLHFLKQGHKIRIIDQLTQNYHPWTLMFQWLPNYLHPNAESSFYSNQNPFPMRQNLFLIEGYAALTISSTDGSPGQIITSLYREPEYVRFFGAVAKAIVQNSHPMFDSIEISKVIPFLSVIDAHVKSGRQLHMINRMPTFRNMPVNLLAEILQDNEITGVQYEQCMSAHDQSTATRGRCECHQVYDLDAIEAAVQQPYIVEYDLSAMIGREVHISHAQFLQQIAYLYDHAQSEHYRLLVYPFSRLDTADTPPCNLIVQDDSFVGAWDASHYERRMYSEQFSIINGFFEYAETLWSHIPPVCKDIAWCHRRLGSILHK